MYVRGEKWSGLVLSRRSTGEADRLLTVLSEQHGLVKVMAKGVRKIPSHRGGHTEPLREVVLVVSGREGRYWASSIETTDYLTALHADSDAMQRAQRLASVLVNLFPEEEQMVSLYRLVGYAWRQLPLVAGRARLLLELTVLLRALHEAGVLVQLTACIGCGARVDTVASPVAWDTTQSGWLCSTCAAPAGALSVDVQALRLMQVLLARPQQSWQEPVDARVADEAAHVLSRHVVALLESHRSHLAAPLGSLNWRQMVSGGLA